eukprot:gene7781-15918_t
MFELSQPATRIAIFVLGSFGVFACLLIVSIHGDSVLGGDEDVASLPLKIALQSDEAHNSLVSTIALSTLLLLELLLDSYNSSKITVASIAVWVQCLAVLLPSYLILFYINSKNLYFMPGIMNSKYLLLACSNSLLISEYSKHNLNQIYIFLGVASYTTFQVLACGVAFENTSVITVHGRVHRYEAARLHERKEQELNQKRSFVRHVSHEIRTPLSTVTMGIQLLKRSLNTGGGNVDINALNDIVSDLEGSCETAIEILNELLDYEKLEAGIMTIDKTRIMMKALLDKNIRPFHLHANEKNIDLRVNYDVENTGPGISKENQ